MFLVEMDVRLGFTGDPLTEEQITDLIEELVDELDHLPVEPSVGTVRVGDDIELTIGVVVDRSDQFEALPRWGSDYQAGPAQDHRHWGCRSGFST